MSSRYTSDPAEEVIILTTQDGKPIGRATREECHKGQGKTHWGLLAIVKRSDGRIILARRSGEKSVFANIWDGSVATHVLRGDTPQTAASRETQEELGISVRFTLIGGYYYNASDGDHAENEFCSLLMGTSDDMMQADPKEVSEVKEITFEQLDQEITQSPNVYSPWLKIGLRLYGDQIASHR